LHLVWQFSVVVIAVFQSDLGEDNQCSAYHGWLSYNGFVHDSEVIMGF